MGLKIRLYMNIRMIFMKITLKILISCILFVLCQQIACAQLQQQAVQAGGVTAVLLKPAKPRASIILLTGGNGLIDISQQGDILQGEGNQLVRTRADYAARGFAVLVPNVGYDLQALVTYMAAIKKPVAVVGTSRGTLRAAQGIAAGARPDKLVLTSGLLSNESGSSENVMTVLGTPDNLPPTLIIHHREDGCWVSAPAGVAPFMAWAKAKARVIWLAGGTSTGNECQPWAHHGFAGIDNQVVNAVSAFVR